MSRAWEALKRRAISAIEKQGALLVYPIKNKSEPLSLWQQLYPRTPMKWDWSDDADNRVNNLWILREELSRSKEVVYAKWYQGRATFFSKHCFVNLLAYLNSESTQTLTPESHIILELLEMDSPLSTKQIKRLTDLRGRSLEPIYNRAMKPLWNNLLILGFGEIDEGHFPSLQIGATRILFEDLWNEAAQIPTQDALVELGRILNEKSLMYRYLKKLSE